jgi:hypothetical protein
MQGEGESFDPPVSDNFMDFGTTSPESGAFWSSESDQESNSEPSHDSHPVTEGTVSGVPEPEEEELPAFDEQYRQDFIGLTFVGKLSWDFEWMGHRFKIKTLMTDELIQIGLVHAKFQNTLSDVKAYQTLVVAACLETLDGKQLPVPITNDVDLVEARFEYIKNHWYPWTIDAVYEQYLLLEVRVQKVIAAMGKASGSVELIPG